MEHACRSFLALAEIGIKHVLGGHGEGRDALILSTVFTWRHYIELRLKLLVVADDSLHSRPRRELKGHRLNYWWKIARAAITATFPDEDHATHLPAVDLHVEELDRLDPGAVSFRYTIEKDGSSALQPGLAGFDWDVFAGLVDEVSTTLEGAAAMFAGAVEHAVNNPG